MYMRGLLRNVLILFVLAACARQYPIPNLEGAHGFPGIRDFVGMEKRVRVIMTHGMCSNHHRWHGDANWVGRRSENLATTIGIPDYEREDPYEESDSFPQSAPKDERIVRRFDVPLRSKDGVTYDVTFFVFGEAIDPAREALEYENKSGDGFPDEPRRAGINAKLKRSLINHCLIDAVVYLGTAGNPVRAAMREAFCSYLGGRVGENTGAANEKTHCEDIQTREDTPVVLVPESLGSKVLFDAFTDIVVSGGDEKKLSALGRVVGVHLVSNQIPLLQQSIATDPRRKLADQTGGGLKGFLNAIQQTSRLHPRAKIAPIPIVAYTDPNDLLSYRLRPDTIPSGSDFQLVNVLVSNANTYLGTWESPLDAHQGYERSEIFQMILHGSDVLQ